jgi:predicted nucleotidyltransferase
VYDRRALAPFGFCGIMPPMDRDQTIALLKRHKPEMQRRFGVLRLALFGSRARGLARPESDADILVAFDGPADSGRYFGLQFYLEDLLGCPVDLVTEQALRPRLRPFVEQDAINV